MNMLLIFLLLFVPCILGHPNGAPCGELRPKHDGGPSGVPPYEITLDVHESSCYPANRPLVVTLRGTHGANIRGFVIGAYGLDDDKSVGVFAYPQTQSPFKYHCETGNKEIHSRVTHKDNDDKDNISIYWRWERPNQPFKFVATIVRSYNVWYESAVQSFTLRPCFSEAAALSSLEKPASTTANSKKLSIASPPGNSGAPGSSSSSAQAPALRRTPPSVKPIQPKAPASKPVIIKSPVTQEPQVAESVDINTCVLQKDPGHPHCETGGWSWRYHWQTPYCYPFWYGGCEGNENNFQTWEDCHKQCHKMVVLERQRQQDAYDHLRRGIN